nr:MAG TPA: hypothetical protein [Caudoviricetes sp.]
MPQVLKRRSAPVLSCSTVCIVYMCNVYELNSSPEGELSFTSRRSVIHRVQPADSPAASWC